MFSTPICVPIDLTTDDLEIGSTIKFDIDSNGKKAIIFTGLLVNQIKIKCIMPSKKY